jgi:tetratricopeptide (TPR) repeat protein
MSNTFQQAYAAHQNGQWPVAERAYATLLKDQPRHADGLHLFGLLRHQQGRHTEAAALIRQALEQQPELAGAWLNLGNALKALGHLDEATGCYQRAAELQPGFTAAHANLGNALAAAGRDGEAVIHYRRALELEPDNAGALNNLGNALANLGQADAAIAAFETALRHAPQHAGALNNLGNARKAAGELERAVEHFRAALAIQPDFALAWFNLGHALDAMDRCADAVPAYQRALALQPDWLAARYGLAHALTALERCAEARAHFEQVLKVDPGFALAWHDMGTALYDMGEFEAAAGAFERALQLRPELAIAAYSGALVKLLHGDLRRGWSAYEARWRVFAATGIAAPCWHGATPLAGRTILLHAEQGLGDTVQLVRYVPLVARRAAHVILEVQAELLTLLQPAALAWGVTLLPTGAARPAFDCHCPLLSLPLAFNTTLTTIPVQTAYLKPPTEPLARYARWRTTALTTATPRRIGLVWSGRLKSRRENRAIPLSLLEPLLQQADVDWVLLQKDPAESDGPALQRILRHPRVQAPAYPLDDFADTAALIATLDCVITIDTSVAHVAAALGKPTWILLPFAPDWRWLLRRDDSPWYPSMRLFRQSAPGDWAGVVEAVEQALSLN